MQERRERAGAPSGAGPAAWLRSPTVPTKVLLAFLFLTAIFTASSGYSLLKHHAVATELRLISRGYLKMAFTIVELRTTQRLQTVQLENLIEERDEAFVRGWITSVRRIRPIVLSNLKANVDDLLTLTSQPEERAFLLSVNRKIEETQVLYATAEDDYQVLFALLDEGIGPEAEEILKLLRQQEEEIASILRHLQNISVQRITTVTARSEQAETRTLWMVSALILLTVSIGLLTAYFIHRLLMPLGELRRGVEIIGKGNLDYRVNVRRGDEIGQFASQLNLMAAALQERDRRLILTERLAAIGKMASHIAHEVKNPLSSIGLNTELVSEEAREIGDEKRRGEILALTTSISREVDRMTSLVNHYLQFGRPPKPSKADTDLGALVAEVRDFMAPEMRSAGVRIDVCAPGEAVVAGVDRDQIKQVMINLLKNAMEAMDDSAARSVRLELEKSADHAILTISDTGRGMTGEEREKIFEPFYSSKKGGSGLGLPLTRQIVLDHGGSIEVASEKGVGTTFEIALPLS